MSTRFTETLTAVASEFGVAPDSNPHRKPRPSKRPYFRWTDEQLEQLATLRDEGKSANEIAEALGVSRDKVITKLAAMAARQRTGSKTPEPSTEPVPEVEAEPEQEAEIEPSIESKPEPVKEPVDIDRIIFAAFSEFIGLVDNYDRTADCWRQAMHTIEQHLSGCVALVREHPETEESVCRIAAIVAYDELKA